MDTPANGGLEIESRTNIATVYGARPLAEFLIGSRLAIVSSISNGPLPYPFSGGTSLGFGYYLPLTDVSVYDISTPAAPNLMQDDLIDGGYAGGYVVGSNFYAVLQNRPGSLPGPQVFSDGKGGFVYESIGAYEARLLPQIPELFGFAA